MTLRKEHQPVTTPRPDNPSSHILAFQILNLLEHVLLFRAGNRVSINVRRSRWSEIVLHFGDRTNYRAVARAMYVLMRVASHYSRRYSFGITPASSQRFGYLLSIGLPHGNVIEWYQKVVGELCDSRHKKNYSLEAFCHELKERLYADLKGKK